MHLCPKFLVSWMWFRAMLSDKKVSLSKSQVNFWCFISFSDVEMQRGPEANEGSNMEIGHVIGAAIAGCVLTVILALTLYYCRYRKKQFNVSKTEETSLHDTSSHSKYSTIPRGNGAPRRGTPSTSSSHSTASKDSDNKRRKTSSPLKMFRLFRKHHSPAEAV